MGDQHAKNPSPPFLAAALFLLKSMQHVVLPPRGLSLPSQPPAEHPCLFSRSFSMSWNQMKPRPAATRPAAPGSRTKTAISFTHSIAAQSLSSPCRPTSRAQIRWTSCKIRSVFSNCCTRSGAPPARNLQSIRQKQSSRRFPTSMRILQRRSLPADLANKAGLTPRYYTEVFKKNIGKSPIEYVTGYRMDQAKKLLRESKKP